MSKERKGSLLASVSGSMKGGAMDLAAVESETTVYEGYLSKMSSGPIKRWQKRYFVLTPSALRYYQDETTAKTPGTAAIKGSMDITDIRQCITQLASGGSGAVDIILTVGDQNISFRAQSDTLAQHWKAHFEAQKRKGGKNHEWDSGGVARGDAKDSEDFEYLTYPACPQWTDKHRSLMAKFCTPEMFEKLKDVTTDTGYTFHNAIQTGTETPHLGVGITAGDEDSYDKFKDIIYPIIAGWHGGYDAAKMKHPTDLNPAHLCFNADQMAKFSEYVVSTRIRAARNIRGFPLPPGSTRDSAAAVEGILRRLFSGLEGDLQGTYYPLDSLDLSAAGALREAGFLFQKPKTTNLLTNAGAARFWPESRGIFHNDNKTALAWCNEEDHCRIISMANGGDVKDVFSRFCALSEAIKAAAIAEGADLMHSESLGFIGTCPSNLGTGLRASVMLVVPRLNEDVHLLHKVCAAYDLQPRGSAGEHSAAVGAKWDISNKQRIGFSEVQLVQKMIDGVAKLIAIEEQLAAGASSAAIETSLGM